MYDVVIIGAGAAGITAAIYAARAKLNYAILSKDVGGLTLWSSDIENYTGLHNLSGIELVEKFQEHMKDYDIEVKEEAVVSVEKKEAGFLVKSDKGEYETKTIVVCAGSSPRKLDVKGAEQYEKKGLFYCATCDGPLFAGKEVAVIGGGDAALDAANILVQMKVKKVTIINKNPGLTGKDKALVEKVTKAENVEVVNDADTLEIYGEEFVKGLKYKQGEEVKDLAVEGIFVEIGHVRNVDFLGGLVELNDKKEIVVDKTGKTSIDGIYAAGDITDLPGKQTIIAAGDGSRALLSAFDFLTKR